MLSSVHSIVAAKIQICEVGASRDASKLGYADL